MYVILMVIMVVGLIVLLEKLADIDSSNNGNAVDEFICLNCGNRFR